MESPTPTPQAARAASPGAGSQWTPARSVLACPREERGCRHCPPWPGSPGWARPPSPASENGTRNPTPETLYAVTAQLGVPLTRGALRAGGDPHGARGGGERDPAGGVHRGRGDVRAVPDAGRPRRRAALPAHQPGVTEHVTVFAGSSAPGRWSPADRRARRPPALRRTCRTATPRSATRMRASLLPLPCR